MYLEINIVCVDRENECTTSCISSLCFSELVPKVTMLVLVSIRMNALFYSFITEQGINRKIF
jgi:hypothetical protein